MIQPSLSKGGNTEYYFDYMYILLFTYMCPEKTAESNKWNLYLVFFELNKFS